MDQLEIARLVVCLDDDLNDVLMDLPFGSPAPLKQSLSRLMVTVERLTDELTNLKGK